MLEKFFHLKENRTDVKTEIMAGITTFMTMAYILAVNPNILSAAGMDSKAVLIATALASFIATALMAVLANYPFALAPGIIQSVPSPRAEPFKLWLAQVGRERIEETIDPEQAIDRALETYQKKGYDTDWIHQRLLSIRVRNELTAEWQERGVQQGKEYAILTDEITKAWSGMSTRQYKKLKGLKKENLRDNMSTMEIVLNMLAEATTTELSKAHQPEGFSESQTIARRGGSYAGQVRQDIEKDTGRPVITSQNAAQLNAVVVDMIESVAETEKPDNDENK